MEGYINHLDGELVDLLGKAVGDDSNVKPTSDSFLAGFMLGQLSQISPHHNQFGTVLKASAHKLNLLKGVDGVNYKIDELDKLF